MKICQLIYSLRFVNRAGTQAVSICRFLPAQSILLIEIRRMSRMSLNESVSTMWQGLTSLFRPRPPPIEEDEAGDGDAPLGSEVSAHFIQF